MAAQGGGDMDPGDVVNENVKTLSASELIWSLKSAFQKSYFTEVESVLVAREQKLRSEIEGKTKECNLLRKERDLLEEKHGMEMIEKSRVEMELQGCRRDCIQLKEANSRLTEKVVRLKGIAKEKQAAITELKRKNCDLEYAKSKADIEVDVYKTKCEELEKDLAKRVSKLEEELMLLKNLESMDPESARVSGVVFGQMAKIDCVKTEVDVDENVHCDAGDPPSRVPEDEGGNLDTGHTAVGPPSCVPEDGGRDLDTAVTGEKKMTENEEVESGINVEKKGEKLVINEVDMFDCDVSVHLGTNAGPSCLLPENVHGDMATAEGNRMSKNGEVESRTNGYKSEAILMNDSEPSKNRGCLSNTDGKDSGRPSSENIIEILDSDDDSTPCEISSATKMATPAFMDNAHIGTESGSGVLKRKWALCVNKAENDAMDNHNVQDTDCSCPSSKNKKAKVQELIDVPNSFPVKHCSTAATTSTPTNLAALMQSGERMGTDHKSININSEVFPDGADSSSSSSSDSDEYPDFSVDFSCMTRSWQRGHLNEARRRWVFETDIHMINEFQKDQQLCLEAVCALYRQQIWGSSTSQNRGFYKSSKTRGTALAKFLIDGDPKGKLKKSKEALMAYDSKGLDDCRSIAISHSKQLFEIYQKKEDALFLN